MSPREKWQAFLRGEDVGPLVAPLVDDWCLEEPYRWPYDEPEPYPCGHESHAFGQQLAMAALCDYDPLFLAFPPFVQRHPLVTEEREREENGRVLHELRTATPYGDLCSSYEQAESVHVLKPEVETPEDYQRELWVLEQEGDLDEAASIARGQALLVPLGDKGAVGTWWGAPAVRGLPREDWYYHLADYPELFRAAIEAMFRNQMKQIELLRAMGFDYLFYCVDGTEWISPDYFEEFIAPYTATMLARWRELGGFVVWHSCGHVARLLERGVYNRFLPEIFETMSEPPYGDLPSLRWGRERLDPRITTKGNIDLQLLHDGPEEAIRAAVRRVKAETVGFRHIIGASDDILHGTPLAHMQAFVDEARQ